MRERLRADDDERAASAGESSDATSRSASGTDTETEIAQIRAKSRKTLKRKRRATSPSRFGETLESLLETEAGTGSLGLEAGAARRQKEAKLERGARRVLEGERKEREERGRVREVIGGWGAEGERALRKVAQRGVITLFNAIQQSQAAAEAAGTAAREARGSGKPTLPAPDPDRNERKKKAKANAIGKGKDDVLDQERFLAMIRGGGVVSSA